MAAGFWVFIPIIAWGVFPLFTARSLTHTRWAMKILHPDKIRSGECHQQPEPEPGKTRPAAVVGSRNNEQSLRRMLECISEYRARKMQTVALVNELEFHLQSMIAPGHEWQQAFFVRWRDLDREHTRHLENGGAEIPAESVARIEAALDDICHLVSGALQRAGRD